MGDFRASCSNRREALSRFYSILERLSNRVGGPRLLSACSGRMNWPARGIYIFFEQGQSRLDTGEGTRVVRIGTHALKTGSQTTLWTRLSQHRGQTETRGGNHRGSIFRQLVGGALIARDDLEFPTWGHGSTADRSVRLAEFELERRTSDFLGQMTFLWLEIADVPGPDSFRGYVERNAIALLSNYGKLALDPPSPNWLGHYSTRERVRNSGLWNQIHVDASCDPAFLDNFDAFVRKSDNTP